jgi:hypothetical protein
MGGQRLDDKLGDNRSVNPRTAADANGLSAESRHSNGDVAGPQLYPAWRSAIAGREVL